jgi:hypothetical protein
LRTPMNVFKLSRLAEFVTLKWFINSNREKDRGGKLPPHCPVSVSASDGSLPGGSFKVDANTPNSTTVTVEVCAIAAGTPPAVTYNVSTY